jgi:predicted RNA-binding Zn ribbon-like protein
MVFDKKGERMASEEPGGRAPAPGELALVQSFINTNDCEGGSDELENPERLGAWLAAHHLLTGPAAISEEAWRRAIMLREGLRMLALVNNGATVDEPAIAEVNRVLDGLRLSIRFDRTGTARLAPGLPEDDAFLVPLLAAVLAAQENGTWPRLKACRRDVCRWAYYDHSKNNRSIWCTMAICGSREKMRMYRLRRRQDTF